MEYLFQSLGETYQIASNYYESNLERVLMIIAFENPLKDTQQLLTELPTGTLNSPVMAWIFVVRKDVSYTLLLSYLMGLFDAQWRLFSVSVKRQSSISVYIVCLLPGMKSRVKKYFMPTDRQNFVKFSSSAGSVGVSNSACFDIGGTTYIVYIGVFFLVWDASL